MYTSFILQVRIKEKRTPSILCSTLSTSISDGILKHLSRSSPSPYIFCFYNKVNNGTRRSRKHYLLLLATKKRVDTHARFGDDDEITRTATVTAVNSCRALSLPTVLSYA